MHPSRRLATCLRRLGMDRRVSQCSCIGPAATTASGCDRPAPNPVRPWWPTSATVMRFHGPAPAGRPTAGRAFVAQQYLCIVVAHATFAECGRFGVDFTGLKAADVAGEAAGMGAEIVGPHHVAGAAHEAIASAMTGRAKSSPDVSAAALRPSAPEKVALAARPRCCEARAASSTCSTANFWSLPGLPCPCCGAKALTASSETALTATG